MSQTAKGKILLGPKFVLKSCLSCKTLLVQPVCLQTKVKTLYIMAILRMNTPGTRVGPGFRLDIVCWLAGSGELCVGTTVVATLSKIL